MRPSSSTTTSPNDSSQTAESDEGVTDEREAERDLWILCDRKGEGEEGIRTGGKGGGY